MAETSSRLDQVAVERALGELIRSLGLDSAAEPELARTPARLAALYAEIFSGLEPANAPDLALIPRTGKGDDELVVVRDLSFYSLCIHHFIPFFGSATVAYLPGEKLLGISGIARLLEHYARRPQLQERITTQIADHLEKALRPRGVAVMLQARHLCMEMRGIRKRGLVETRLVRGELAEARWTSVLPAPSADVGPHE
jgi:GTP cyclohydrolase I